MHRTTIFKLEVLNSSSYQPTSLQRFLVPVKQMPIFTLQTKTMKQSTKTFTVESFDKDTQEGANILLNMAEIERQFMIKSEEDVISESTDTHMISPHHASSEDTVSSSASEVNCMAHFVNTREASTQRDNVRGIRKTITRRRRWSELENAALRDAVSAIGLVWSEVARIMHEKKWNRSAKQCRERYMSHEREGLRHGEDWTSREDATLRSLYIRNGPKWALIARAPELQGRAPVAVRNRYNWALSRRA